MKMYMRSMVVGSLLALLGYGCGGKNVEALLPNMASNFESIQTYELTPTLYIPQAGTDVQVKTAFKYPNKMRADVTYPMAVTVVCDGKRIMGCVPEYNTCIQLDLMDQHDVLPTSALLVLMIPHLNYVRISDRYDTRIAGKETMGSRKAVVFDLVRKTAPESSFQAPKAKIWVEEDRAVPLRMETMNEQGVCKTRSFFDNFVEVQGVWLPQEVRMETGDGVPLVSLMISDMSVNEALSDELFVINAPEDCMVLDEIPVISSSDIPDLLLLY